MRDCKVNRDLSFERFITKSVIIVFSIIVLLVLFPSKSIDRQSDEYKGMTAKECLKAEDSFVSENNIPSCSCDIDIIKTGNTK